MSSRGLGFPAELLEFGADVGAGAAAMRAKRGRCRAGLPGYGSCYAPVRRRSCKRYDLISQSLRDADATDRATAYGIHWAQLSNMRAYAVGNPFRITRIGCATRKLHHAARVFPVYVCDAVFRDKRNSTTSCARLAIDRAGEIIWRGKCAPAKAVFVS